MNKTVKQIALFLLIGLVILMIFQLNQGGKENTGSFPPTGVSA